MNSEPSTATGKHRWVKYLAGIFGVYFLLVAGIRLLILDVHTTTHVSYIVGEERLKNYPGIRLTPMGQQVAEFSFQHDLYLLETMLFIQRYPVEMLELNIRSKAVENPALLQDVKLALKGKRFPQGTVITFTDITLERGYVILPKGGVTYQWESGKLFDIDIGLGPGEIITEYDVTEESLPDEEIR